MNKITFQGKTFPNALDAWVAAKMHYLTQGRKAHEIPGIIASRHSDLHRAYVAEYNGAKHYGKSSPNKYVPSYFA